ncbi:MAG: MATE family efflux transporter [Polyangiales bacterium]
MVVGMVLHTLFNLIDMFMISRLPNASAALAALAICDMVAAIATILSNGIGTASVALIGRYQGANNTVAVRRTVFQSLWLVGIASIVFGCIGIFGSDWIVRSVARAKGRPLEIAIPYLRIVLGGCFGIFLLLQITAILRALGTRNARRRCSRAETR